ncbi:MAG: CRISPR-associated helicase Cas3' [Bacteroidales bacterium]|nr:CRISPR-associated helicase Cas3' [Bacteroidales bacterium]
MKLFKCFKDNTNELIKVFSKLQKPYFAHLSPNNQDKESLLEHSKLVSKYCLKLIEVHGIENRIDSILDKLINILSIKNQESWGNSLKEVFIAGVIYHDLGKINPNFQLLKMKNFDFKENKRLSIQSKHSFLGAYIYSNIFFKRILENEDLKDDNEKLLMYFIVLLFSSTIKKHHSPTISLDLEFDNVLIDDCYSFLDRYYIQFDEQYSKSFFVGAKDIYDGFINIVKNNDVYFELFALTKLLYSLLTASDFYATNEYMNSLEINEFGLLSSEKKNQIEYSFKSVKPYNHDLYAQFDFYKSFPFENLQERSALNLNILRQKLTAEIISNIKNNNNAKCFYIEAPTGAGKTNLSLAFITELFKIDSELNKVFYVFPFTTLITQTFNSIKETLDIDDDHIIQLHSKADFHESNDAVYGNQKRLYIDNLFVNYPISLLSHVRFFDILKGNGKESNYLFHRLCNSIIIIDEIQTYNPEHWDKIVYFIANYAQLLNIRFLIMSATLPKIDALHDKFAGSFVSLVSHREKYFQNPNFAGRVSFDFSLIDQLKKPDNNTKEEYLINLADFLLDKSEQYALNSNGKAKVLIEFITKKTASLFFEILNKNFQANDYVIYLLSGDILEFRRKQIINSIKLGDNFKVIVVSTQVIEAGVDIDMDLGFKDKSLIDSDEQLAGRINRNASKNNCIVYLFDCDNAKTIYGTDTRYKIQQTDREIYDDYKKILIEKQFHSLYEKVFEAKRKRMMTNLYSDGQYYSNFMNFDFWKIHKDFVLIENNDSQQLFIPISIPIEYFENRKVLTDLKILSDDFQFVDGEKVFILYENIIHSNVDDYIMKKINLKIIGSIMAQFSISVYRKQLDAISTMLDPEKCKTGFQYLLHYKLCYSSEYGFDSIKIDTSNFL